MPLAAYATLADLKAFIGEEGNDEDEALRMALDGASAAIERYLAWDPTYGERTVTVWGGGARYLFLPFDPTATVLAVGSVSYPYGAGETKVAEIYVSTNRITRKDGALFDLHQPYTVTYTAGFDPLPEDLVTACKITAQAFYEAAAVDPNVQMRELPVNAQALIRHLRRTFA